MFKCLTTWNEKSLFLLLVYIVWELNVQYCISSSSIPLNTLMNDNNLQITRHVQGRADLQLIDGVGDSHKTP